MLTSNLIPEEYKKNLKIEKVQRFVVIVSIALTIIAVLNIIFILPTYLPLLSEQKGINQILKIEQSSPEKLKLKESIVEAKKVNERVASIQEVIALPARASSLLDIFLSRAGNNIEMETISVSVGGNVSISGFARTRKSLLDFENALRDSGFFQTIDSPISNIIKEVDIRFTIQILLNPNLTLKDPESADNGSRSQKSAPAPVKSD